MSVINKMLQDLDRRNAADADALEAGTQAVRPVSSERRGPEWFWRVLALLIALSVAWVGWVAYQLQPRPLVTPLALLAAERSRAATPSPKTAPPQLRLIEAPKAEPPAVEPPQAEALKSVEPPNVKPAKGQPKVQAHKPAVAPTARPAPPLSSPKAVVDKREGSDTASGTAETRFRRAALLLGQGRVSEAEEQLAAALQADPAHVAARQAYVSLLLEQQRVPAALRLLREAVDVNPGQATFSLGLARIYAEQRDYVAALAVMEKAGAAGQRADFQVLRAAVLQRLGRHAEAVTAYQDALQNSSQPGGTWAGLGVSLEAVGRQGEAAQAYKRALALGPLPRELRDYAEQRLHALQ